MYVANISHDAVSIYFCYCVSWTIFFRTKISFFYFFCCHFRIKGEGGSFSQSHRFFLSGKKFWDPSPVRYDYNFFLLVSFNYFRIDFVSNRSVQRFGIHRNSSDEYRKRKLLLHRFLLLRYVNSFFSNKDIL